MTRPGEKLVVSPSSLFLAVLSSEPVSMMGLMDGDLSELAPRKSRSYCACLADMQREEMELRILERLAAKRQVRLH